MKRSNLHMALATLFDQKAARFDGKEAILFTRKGSLESQITCFHLHQISNMQPGVLDKEVSYA